MEDFIERLKQRKLVQWALAYAAAAFASVQLLDIVAQRFGWPEAVERFTLVAMAVGFLVTLVLAWYHGERGAQKTTGTELLILALLLAIGGVAAWRLAPAPTASAAAAAAASPPAAVAPATAIPDKSIAVLPFRNMSGDPAQAYFSDGITEEILNALAQIPNLKVAARTSAFQFKSDDKDLHRVGEILGVATVLQGSVQKAGDEVRIAVRLMDTRSGYQLWSEKYDRKLTNIFALEDDISNAIAGQLRVQLTGGAGQALVPRKPIDPRAHDFYLTGLGAMAARTSGLRGAKEAFEAAVKIEPGYAQAWGALAETEMLLPGYQPDVPARVAYPRAQAAAERALAIDPDSAEAYVALSVVYGTQWEKREQALQRALQLAPGTAEVVYQHAYFLLLTGNLDAALREMDHALQLNPLSPIIAAERVETLIYMHRYADALKQADATIAAHPDFPLTYGYGVLAEVMLRRYDDAAAYLKRAASMPDFQADFGIDAASLSVLLQGVTDPAKRAAALRVAANLESAGQNQSEWLCMLGANEQALAAVERAFEIDSDPDLTVEVMGSPMLDPIRNDARFKAVLRKMGLPYTPLHATGG